MHDSESTRFAAKDQARAWVWRRLQEAHAAAFPFPVQGRIPNFVGSGEAARRLLAHPLIQGATRLKVNPDSPQRRFRELALGLGIELILPTPRLAGGFRRLDPGRIPWRHHAEASTIDGAAHWGEEVPVRDLPPVDAVIAGSVAVTRGGRRCGKGHGYGDLEYALLRSLGHPAVPVLTSVHALQIVDDFPADGHDLPVAVIVTATETITVAEPPRAPDGIDWSLLSDADLETMPVLQEARDARTR